MAEACPSDHHLEHVILDDIFSSNIDELFNILFSDSDFYRKFTAKRKTYDIKLEEWKRDDCDEGQLTRRLQYTLSINYSIGPKCSPSKEIQTMYAESKRGEKYLIDADCYNGGIPYADSFHTTVRYCMKSRPDNKTKLVVTCRVNFSKNVSSFIKMFLEKTAINGIRNSFNEFAHLLRLELSAATNPQEAVPRRRLKHINKEKSKVSCSCKYKDENSLTIRRSTQGETFDYAGFLLTFLIVTLLVISVMNAFMYMQILTMENSLERLVSSRTD